MGAEDSSLGQLCCSQTTEEEEQVNTELSQQHQRTKTRETTNTENYQQIDDNDNEFESGDTDDTDVGYDDEAVIALLEREVKSAKNEIERVITQYNLQLQQAKDDFTKLQVKFNDESKQKSQLVQQLQESVNQNQTLTSSQTTIQLERDAKIDEYKQQINDENNEYETEINKYKQQINEYKQQINENNEYETEINKYRQTVSNLEAKISEYEISHQEMNALNKTVEILQNELNQYQQSQNEINPPTEDEKIKHLKSEIIQLKNVKSVVDELNQSLKLKLAKANELQVQSVTELNDLRWELDDIKNQQEEAENIKNTLQKQNQTLQETSNQHQTCQNIISELKANNSELQEENQMLSMASDSSILQDKIDQIQNEKTILFKSMVKEKENVSKLEDKISQYKIQINDLESQYENNENNETEINNNSGDSEYSEGNSENNDEYFAQFASKPFGLTFGSTNDKKNLIVTKLDANSTAVKQNVIVQSKIIKLQDEIVEDLGARNIYKMFTNKFANQLPLKITFRKPNQEKDDQRLRNIYEKINKSAQLDEKFDATTEANHVYSWLKIDSNNKKAVQQLKEQLASLLTTRSHNSKEKLKEIYLSEYGKSLIKDIKAIIGKGFVMDIISGLLMTCAQYDAILLTECITNMDIESVADIICCRTVNELKELRIAYKKKSKLDIKKQLQALAQNEKKHTLLKVIGGVFEYGEREEKNENVDVDMNLLTADLNFILTAKKFKDEAKERLVMIFTSNSVKYIQIFNQQFIKSKSKDSLTTFIDKKLGNKSSAGYFCKTRILYALDTGDYYAQKIKKLGNQYKKNQKKIANIFIQRMEIDLNEIKNVWIMKKYGDGKDLKQWIAQKTSGSNDAYFYQKMLDNCTRYA